MIGLPGSPRSGQLRIFAALLGLGGGIALSIVLSAVDLAVLLVPLGLVTGLLASWWTEPVIFLYRVTGKLARVFVFVAQAWISALAFAVVLAAGRGRRAASMALDPDRLRGTLWNPTTDNRSGLREGRLPLGGGLPAFLHWTRESGNWWAALLLPFCLILRALDPGRDTETVPSNVYTLF